MSQAPLHHGFWQWLQSGDTERMALVTIPLFFILLAIIATTGLVANSIHRRRTEADLKRELLDRGMSAEEIATVIAATSTRGKVDVAVRQPGVGSKA
jgi:hypothetical protein